MIERERGGKSALVRPVSLVLALAPAVVGCSSDEPCSDCGVSVSMDYRGGQGFYALPFPNDARRADDGSIALSDFPNPTGNAFVAGIVGVLAEDARGFATTSGVFFRTDAPIVLPPLDVLASTSADAPVLLVAIDPDRPRYLERHPLSVAFLPDGGPYGAPNLLVLLPLQGLPLEPSTRYAAAVLTSLTDQNGVPLRGGDASWIGRAAAGEAPEGMSAAAFASHRDGIAALAAMGIDAPAIAGLTVFTTGDPTGALAEVSAAMLADAPPEPNAPFAANELFDDFCVYESTIDMPVYQGGEPPYDVDGGAWVFDDSGAPALQRHEEANIVVTIPRAPMPRDGYPLVVFSRTGGGGERPLCDRGVRAEPGGEAVEPGEGPARYLAQAGFAGVSVDGPHGGLRNVTGGDEQFLVFNYDNPAALRDNLRQSAAELALVAHLFDSLALPLGDCPGASAPDGLARIDTDTMAIMGHSMGASIAPLSLAVEPRFDALLLSGAGGSFIENVLHKQKPLATKPLVEILLGLAASDYQLGEHDPMLSLLQWAGEPADVPPYALRARDPAVRSAAHVLMMQGIVDHYILPPIANATSLSFGLDLGGAPLDQETSELDVYAPLASLLALTGRAAIELPAGGNAGGATAIVSQYPEDGVEDGHEVMFQTEAPKHAYRCFLASLAQGTPIVPPPGALAASCPE